MDPATIYAITVTLAGIGSVPSVAIEKLPPQWTLADCIKHHEKTLAGTPNTRALCVSRDRFKHLFFEPKTYLVSIHSDTRAVDLTKWNGTLSECQGVVSRFADKVTAFCVETRKLQRSRKARFG